MSSWVGRPGAVPPLVPTTESAGCINQVHSYRCQSCGRSVSLGATCECNVVLADDRIAAALERIAAAIERLVPDGRHTQQPSQPSSHDHTRCFGS